MNLLPVTEGDRVRNAFNGETFIFTHVLEEGRSHDLDPLAWLADVLGRINAHPARALADLLPWNWRAAQANLAAAA